MVKMSLRFGIHDFLNAQPLLLPLQDNTEHLNISLTLDTPAHLAERLKSGELDAAMIPSIEFLREAYRYRLVSGVCIASEGPVDSVLLATKKPLESIRSLAVDCRSRTSVALLAILFDRRVPPEVLQGPADPDPNRMLELNDAALIIGDQALLLDRHHPHLTFYDLSEEWTRITHKPFVHAVIAVRPEVRLDPLFIEFLQKAKDSGLDRLGEIVQSERVEKLGLSYEDCRRYLVEKIRYVLDEPELDGLKHFRDACFKAGILAHQYPITFA